MKNNQCQHVESSDLQDAKCGTQKICVFRSCPLVSYVMKPVYIPSSTIKLIRFCIVLLLDCLGVEVSQLWYSLLISRVNASNLDLLAILPVYLQNMIISFCFWFARFWLSPCSLTWASSRTTSRIKPQVISVTVQADSCRNPGGCRFSPWQYGHKDRYIDRLGH